MYPYSYSVIGLIVFLLDIFAIASVVTGRSSVERKLLWSLVILILPLVGMALYYIVGRSNRDTALT